MESKYRKIYTDFVEKINAGTLCPGDSLPSEGKLIEQYQASRDTVRKAMTLLEQNHYILKSRGRESTVADRAKLNFPVSRITTFTELAEAQHLHCETIVEDLSVVAGDEKLMRLLEIDAEAEVYRLARARRIDGARVILDLDYLLRRVVPQLPRKVCQGSLYRYLEKDLGLKIGVAKKIITVQPATRQDRLWLDLKDDTVVAVVASVTHLADGTPFQYTESHHRIDRFQFESYAQRQP
ncbi:MAG: trehalose operon repressor [Gemmiger sp.]|nr:trehalose operon repressor [Gemmiger sp.]